MELLHTCKEVLRWHNTQEILAPKPGVKSGKVILRINATPSEYRDRTYFMA